MSFDYEASLGSVLILWKVQSAQSTEKSTHPIHHPETEPENKLRAPVTL